jgi:hypothetical protein
MICMQTAMYPELVACTLLRLRRIQRSHTERDHVHGAPGHRAAILLGHRGSHVEGATQLFVAPASDCSCEKVKVRSSTGPRRRRLKRTRMSSAGGRVARRYGAAEGIASGSRQTATMSMDTIEYGVVARFSGDEDCGFGAAGQH